MECPPLTHSYGSFDDSESNGMPDIERVASGGETPSSSLLSGHRQKEAIAMRPLADQVSDVTSLLSDDSLDSAQAGVKRLEAISSTWSTTGLYTAYLGYVYLCYFQPYTNAGLESHYCQSQYRWSSRPL